MVSVHSMVISWGLVRQEVFGSGSVLLRGVSEFTGVCV